jgi:hypothetical protein
VLCLNFKYVTNRRCCLCRELVFELLSCVWFVKQARRHRTSSGSAGTAAAAASPDVPASTCLQPRRSHAEPPELRAVQRVDSGGSACSRGSMDSGSSDATCLGASAAADRAAAVTTGPAAQPRLCSLAALLDACGRSFVPSRAARSLVATVAVRGDLLSGTAFASLLFQSPCIWLCYKCTFRGLVKVAIDEEPCCCGACQSSSAVGVAGAHRAPKVFPL